jgi:phosphatidylglycerophosphate synthase
MLDGWARRQIDPAIERVATALAAAGASANALTLAAFALGMAAAAAVALGWLWTALALGAASRMGDALDGAVARRRGATDFGGFLDIVLDFAFYGAVPLGFILLDPAANAVAGAVLIAVFYVNGGSVLAFAVMAEKRGVPLEARGAKSLLFSTGLAEATETLLVFAAFCIVPAWFPHLAFAFAALTAWTTLSRILLAWRTFR